MGELCGLCFSTGSSFIAIPINSSVSFVAGSFEISPGSCEWQDQECEADELNGCSYTLSGEWVRGTPPWEETVPVTAIAKPDCGTSGIGTNHTIAGDLTVYVTCTDCVEGP